MEVKDLKWYSPFMYFVRAILSFSDPITDILTLLEFCCVGHKTWFGVGLKKWQSGDKIDPDRSDEAEDVLSHIEAVLESAPQFIVQLYAISVQEEPSAIIQIISLPISFLTLAEAFTATDKRSLAECKKIPSSGDLNVTLQLALYVTHLIFLSSRLFAICYFTVSYKWWVIGVLIFHSCVVVIATVIRNEEEVHCGVYYVFLSILFLDIHCLRDDYVELSMGVDVTGLTLSVFFSYFFLYQKT